MPGLFLVAALIASQAAPVVVEGEACGFSSVLAPALARRGLLAGEETIRVRIDGSAIEIVLLDARGAPTRIRKVPRSPSCAADLDLVVLIVERQKKDLLLAPDDAPLPAQTATDTPSRFTLDVGAFGDTEIATQVRGGVDLAVRLEMSRFLEATVGVRVGIPASVSVLRGGQTIGSIDAWSAGGWVGAGVGFDTGRQRLFAAGSLGLERVTASTTGLFQTADQAVWSLLFGVEGRYEIALIEEKVWLSLAIGGRFRPSAPVFGVEGTDTTFAVPEAALTARAGLWAR